MKLVIQIPCFNEGKTIVETLADLPSQLDGVDSIEYLIIDDGSSDQTVVMAKKHGAHEVLSLPSRQGLAKAFSAGLHYARNAMKADIIVNTDGDHQYQGICIRELIEPILANKADMVIGCRPIKTIPHFSASKKILQKLGSKTVEFITGLHVEDATSGFRAYSRKAARKLRILSDFSYTIETLIQASRTGIRVATVPVQTNPPTRPSRLFKSNFNYIRRQVATLFRVWALYSPTKLFSRIGISSFFAGVALIFRFLYFYLTSYPDPTGKIQSLIISAVFILFGVFCFLFGVIADLIAVNRTIIEDIADRMEQENDQTSAS